MTEPPKIQLSRLQDIAWSIWDPIGLRDDEDAWPADEYDSYMLRVAGMIRDGCSFADAVDYLMKIERDHMSLGSRDGMRERAEATVTAVREYIDQRPKGH